MLDLFQLIYTSHSSQKWNAQELKGLAKQSRFNNFIKQLSGLLLYGEEQFIGVLEGRKEQIETVFEKILRDHRHHAVIPLQQKSISNRAFLNWNIGFLMFSHHPNIEEKLLNQDPIDITYTAFTNYRAISILEKFSTKKFLLNMESSPC